jgi:hypothetical protein
MIDWVTCVTISACALSHTQESKSLIVCLKKQIPRKRIQYFKGAQDGRRNQKR